MKNFRDLSYLGLKEGMLLRSDALGDLTKEDIDILKEHNLKTIIDIRGLGEQKKNPDIEIEDVNHLSMPLSMSREPGLVVINGLQLPDMLDCYKQLVEKDRRETYSKIFDLLLGNNNAILFHCSEGKDRTGVLMAVILSALGIDKELIYKDYLLTNESPLSYKEYAKTLPPEVCETFTKHFSANKEYLDAAFNEINNLYGSIDNFFKECCSLDENKLNLLKDKYLCR